jgi:RNA polymerase sigma-70 factor (ECF subfamily)
VDALAKVAKSLQAVTSREEEDALVARAIAGDAAAFGDLYERHLDRIYRYVFYRIGRDSADAEDLTEAVFLKAWRALDEYRLGATPFASWLYRIAHNAIVDHYRKDRYRQQLEAALHGQQLNQEDGYSLEREVGRQVSFELVAQAFLQLQADHQEVLTLRFINGLSHAETAQIIQRSEGATRVLQFRALKALAALVEMEEGDHE